METNKVIKLSPKVTQAMIAQQCGVSQQAVSLWLKKGLVPAKRIHRFSKVTGISEKALYSLHKEAA